MSAEPRALVAELAAERPKRTFRCCAYCGVPCYGITCREHRDLLNLDVNYREARVRV